MYSKIKQYCDLATQQFTEITIERKVILEKTTAYINAKIQAGENINLMYVCTHNSRRSHFGQVWAAVAAAYYGVENVHTFSGGTEATAFNKNAISALKRVGFKITADGQNSNPYFEVRFSKKHTTTCFSKRYDDTANPKEHFAAIMTCSDAETNCPFMPGVEFRIATTYKDPKAYDGTVLQDFKYSERCLQVAIETLYVFSKLR